VKAINLLGVNLPCKKVEIQWLLMLGNYLYYYYLYTISLRFSRFLQYNTMKKEKPLRSNSARLISFFHLQEFLVKENARY